MKRRDLFNLHKLGTRPAPDNVQTIEPLTTTLQPYRGVWGKEEAAHLLRRASFGAPKDQVEMLAALPFAQAIDKVLVTPPMPTDLPLNNYNEYLETGVPADPDIPFGQTWVGVWANPSYDWRRYVSHLGWWFDQVIRADVSIQHKMTLFWYNHIPAGEGGTDYFKYMMTLRRLGLGNFRDLVRAISIEPCMLLYLNGQKNSALAPDENFGRELLELFVIGKGKDGTGSGYTEDDVKAASRALTGWRFNSLFETSFNPLEHDTNDKQFSAFFNNARITGKSGPTAGDQELDALLDILMAHSDTAKFVCRKMYRFFVYHEIPENVETSIIEPLAQFFRSNNYDIKATMHKLLSSEHFFDIAIRGAIIKCPMDFMLGMARETKIGFPPANELSNFYRTGFTYWYYMTIQQQDMGAPPNVAGWPAWYQIPVYDKAWITTSSALHRSSWTDNTLLWGQNPHQYHFQIDVLAMTQRFNNPSDPDAFVKEAALLLCASGTDTVLNNFLIEQLIAPQITPYYWTQLWNDYLADPNNAVNKNAVVQRLTRLYQTIFQLAEYQLM